MVTTSDKEKKSEYNKEYLRRKEEGKKCVICGNPLPKYKQKLCSDECTKNHKAYYSRKYKSDIQKEFNKFKEDIGCSKCRYNACGAALEYHHIDPQTKNEERNNAETWKHNRKEFDKETEKCHLYCSNCHKEVEYFMNNPEQQGILAGKIARTIDLHK